ncbi:MAG: CTP synthase [Thermoguttaceae bacterium]|nr:CTP synthase [Thermoguttaceae bacterium]
MTTNISLPHVTKHIFVTGGVASSLGKGLTSASIGMLLEHRGLRVRMQKLDPYLNVDPGTMSPYQHGEVYVLDDGSETDLDLGHYERFTNSPLSKDSSLTSGKIYMSVFSKERHGEYLGQTVQVIPHVTSEIRSVISKLDAPDVDVVITEIGGTVGDIESLPYLEAIRQFAFDVGRENCMYVHLTLIPYLRAAGEIKTKPTQHSVQKLRELGIQPDMLICRTEYPINLTERAKIAMFCNVPLEGVIEEIDAKESIYEVPLKLHEGSVDDLVCRRLGLPKAEPDLTEWREVLNRVRNPQHELTIAVVGKYVEHKDAYKSIYEAITHAGIHHHAQISIRRVLSEKIETEGAEKLLGGVDAILVPGGFGDRGVEGKIEAIHYARQRKIPFFGICLGMQCTVIEFARNVLGYADANSTEFHRDSEHPVVCLLDDQKNVTDKGGTMRLGAQDTLLLEGSLAAAAYGRTTNILERHRHRYEFNNVYREQFEVAGLHATGTSPDGTLVEIVEVPDHPWFVAVQFHPEFKSQPTKAHPLFRDFVRAALAKRAAK